MQVAAKADSTELQPRKATRSAKNQVVLSLLRLFVATCFLEKL
jgi:hypothetical protein